VSCVDELTHSLCGLLCGAQAAATRYDGFDGRADLRFQIGAERRTKAQGLVRGELANPALLTSTLNSWILPLARRFRTNGLWDEEEGLQVLLRRVADLTEQAANPRQLVNYAADMLSRQGRTLQGLAEEDAAFQQFLTRAAQQAKLTKLADSAFGDAADKDRRGSGRDDGDYRGKERGGRHREGGYGGKPTNASNMMAVAQRLKSMYAGVPVASGKCFGCHHLGPALPSGTKQHSRFTLCPHKETVAASLNM
jgi:hypothetical protein